jgi:hypothetical protein
MVAIRALEHSSTRKPLRSSVQFFSAFSKKDGEFAQKNAKITKGRGFRNLGTAVFEAPRLG